VVRDLEAAGGLLADSDLAAAIAGGAGAQQAVAADSGKPATVTADPADDYVHADRTAAVCCARAAVTADPRMTAWTPRPRPRHPGRAARVPGLRGRRPHPPAVSPLFP
jgi:hypothetical protein